MTNYRVESSSGRAARKMRLALMGPAFIAAIGYIDPGNFATNIQAGASFGYQLLWVVVWANLMAMTSRAKTTGESDWRVTVVCCRGLHCRVDFLPA